MKSKSPESESSDGSNLPPCERCGGLMTQCAPLDHQIRNIDIAGFEASPIPAATCINCGEYLDRVIIENRIKWKEGKYEKVPHSHTRRGYHRG